MHNRFERMLQMKNLEVKFRLWIDTKEGNSIIGDGRWRLLETIGKTGSLTKACKKLGISYRKAWGDLAQMQEALKIPLLEKHRGGKKGGDTHLTDFGKMFVKTFKKLHKDIEKAVEESMRKNFDSIK